ncbi:MAG: hypothetical protein GWN18_19935 [Thermoplasmata archaeon]|nr:hypothetical protein [Thermoplasmata archaeon]NIS14398.1 hypothetical protein [Thermoplasmata archaeon]NIS22242.1 hypothetical protein [Thermoplasmata archaeon]NIT80125.1 hypothetical protein [Thermoplasmata archaeon]NIU51250.1 hypothetical protein [Thermoplasmata archaeon]
MAQTIYKPIYYTWIALYMSLVLGILIWILGGLIDLPWIWDEFYRAFPSGLLLVFILSFLIAISVFVGVFTDRAYLGAIVAALGGLITVLALWVIGWIMDTWDTTTMIVAVLMLAGIAIGLVFIFFARFAAAIAAWFILSLIFTVWVMLWIESKWGTSTLYWLFAAIALILYVVVAIAHVLIPKRVVEG